MCDWFVVCVRGRLVVCLVCMCLGGWLLACFLFVVWCWLFDGRCLLFVVCCNVVLFGVFVCLLGWLRVCLAVCVFVYACLFVCSFADLIVLCVAVVRLCVCLCVCVLVFCVFG